MKSALPLGVPPLYRSAKIMTSLAELILGPWFTSGIDEAAREDGLIVFRPDGICIQFPTSQTRPDLAPTFRLYYTWEDEETLLYRLSPKGTPWTRKVKQTEFGWTMIYEGNSATGSDPRSFPFRRANPDELPPWYDEMIEICIGMLERRAKKEAEQAGTGQPPTRPELG